MSKLVLCISSGNGAERGYKVPEVGLVYKVIDTRRHDKRTWYVLSSMPDLLHHISLFEELPNDFLTNLTWNEDYKKKNRIQTRPEETFDPHKIAKGCFRSPPTSND